jgi:hypothetical protein
MEYVICQRRRLHWVISKTSSNSKFIHRKIIVGSLYTDTCKPSRREVQSEVRKGGSGED